jgi:hypothetical protein
VRRFLAVTLCYKVSIIPCYLQEVLMRKSLTRQRVAQFKLFHLPQKRPSWQLLPSEVRRKAERLLARLLREHIGRVHVCGNALAAGYTAVLLALTKVPYAGWRLSRIANSF